MTDPIDTGSLDVGDGHRMYWETCGDPAGRPVVMLHGGPGSGWSSRSRRMIGPGYRAVLFDQRGSGRSCPLASDPDADLSTNTTGHLVADIERLREHLGIETWAVLGVSWGTTLGLAYAQAHPTRVDGLVLALVTTTSRREVDWLTEGVGRIFPAEWERFVAPVPDGVRPVDAYAQWLADPDPAVRDRAARGWCAWEDAHVSLTPGYRPNPQFDDPGFRLRFARLVTHYWRNAAFLDDGQLLRDAPRLDGIPGVLIHGRLDVSGPLETAWNLSKRWSTARLHVLDDAGHGGASLPDAISAALRKVTDA